MLALGFVTWYVSRKAIPKNVLRFAPWFAMGIYAFFRRPKRTLPSWTFPVALFSLLAVQQRYTITSTISCLDGCYSASALHSVMCFPC
jgi:hypothetical protein